jgi:CRP-like cAMP-binding protein
MITADAATGDNRRLSTPRELTEFALPSSFVRLRKGEKLYAEGERPEALFSIVTGVVKSYMALQDRTQYIVAFFFPDDLVGLVQNGTHRYSAEALTAVTAYRMPVGAINARLRSDPDLEFQLICQLSHELRAAEAHAFLLSRQRAITRISLFLRMLEAHQYTARGSSQEIYVPMKRSEIAAYAGISLEAVGRSFRTLIDRGAIAMRNRRHVQIISRAAFEAAIFDRERTKRNAGKL